MGIFDEDNDEKKGKGNNTQESFYENLNKVLNKMDKLLELMTTEMKKEIKRRNEFREKIIQQLQNEEMRTAEFNEKMIKEMQEIKTIVEGIQMLLDKEKSSNAH